MDREGILQLDTRRKIYDLILNSPGMHFREMTRRLNLKPGVLRYQLNILEKQELIVGKKHSYYTRYFGRDVLDPEEKNMVSLLRLKIPRHIIFYLLLYPDSCNKEILEEMTMPSSTLSYYLRKLVKADVLMDRVRGRNTYFTVRKPKLVMKLLTTYRTSFFDELTDRLTELWDGI